MVWALSWNSFVSLLLSVGPVGHLLHVFIINWPALHCKLAVSWSLKGTIQAGTVSTRGSWHAHNAACRRKWKRRQCMRLRSWHTVPADRSCNERRTSPWCDNSRDRTTRARPTRHNLNRTSHALARLCFAILRHALIKMQFDLDTAAKLNQSILILLCTLSFDLNQRPIPVVGLPLIESRSTEKDGRECSKGQISLEQWQFDLITSW